MSEETQLWVCPKCHILQGIEVWFVQDELHGRCVNCGVPIPPEDVGFLDVDMAEKIIHDVFKVVPEFFHDYIRFSWVSRRTVGIIFEFGITELIPEVDYDPLSYFEDEIGAPQNLTMTVYFE